MEQPKIFVAGHRGMVGSAIVRKLKSEGYTNTILRERDQLDLVNQHAVNQFFAAERPTLVYLAAAKVGGIYANSTYPAEFIYQNLMIEVNIIQAAYKQNVKRLMFLGSSCIYPKMALQPMAEQALLTGELESTNEPYAIAKIAGIKLCESYNRQYGTDYRSVMPTNLYGPRDNYNLENSHVIPALIRKFHEAKEKAQSSVTVWGTGRAKREFLYVDDMANASVYVMNLSRKKYWSVAKPMLSHINIGTGEDISIAELAELIKTVTRFKGEIVYDVDKPDGTPRKLMDVARVRALGWTPVYTLRRGLEKAYEWYLQNETQVRR